MAVALTNNTPNFLGALFQTDQAKTQFLTLIGGTDGMNSEVASAIEFPISVNFELGEAAQPAISEQASMGAANPEIVTKTQNTNVIQIFQKDISISKMRQRAQGLLSGLAVAGGTPDISDEEAFQLMTGLAKVKRDMNWTAINGVFNKGGLTDPAVALGTRGILEAIETNVVNGELNAENIGELARLVYDNGAFDNPVLFASSVNRQKISQAYKVESLTEVERDRLSGGVAVGKIITEFGDIFIATDNYFGNDAVALVDIPHVRPVFTRDKETGEVIAVTPRDQRGGYLYEIYAEFGLNHGDEKLHAKLNITPGE